jgi:hypothetical protein
VLRVGTGKDTNEERVFNRDGDSVSERDIASISEPPPLQKKRKEERKKESDFSSFFNRGERGGIWGKINNESVP